MIGVNYKYKLNPQKNVITLRPTILSSLAFTAMMIASVGLPMVLIGWMAERYEEKTTPLKNTSEEL